MGFESSGIAWLDEDGAPFPTNDPQSPGITAVYSRLSNEWTLVLKEFSSYMEGMYTCQSKGESRAVLKIGTSK